MVKAHYGLLALALEALTTQEINPAIYSQLLQFLSRYHLIFSVSSSIVSPVSIVDDLY
jgi:hypothetical protein